MASVKGGNNILKLSGILKNRDFWGLFSGGVWIFGLKSRGRGSSCND
jgi:hypothetical protein